MDQMGDGLMDPLQEQTRQNINILQHERTFLSGARWFYWIAGLSLVNTVIHLAKGDVTFVIGLGITQIVDGIAMGIKEQRGEISLIVNVIVIILNGLFAGIFVLFGWLASRKYGWAFIVGLILYSLDGLIFIPFKDWFSVGFHVFAFVCIFSGYNALRKLNQAQIPATQV